MVDIAIWKKWIGVGLIALSGIWFAGLLLVPFAPFSLSIKAVLGLFFLVLMEGSFWLGTLIIGKQVVSRYWKSIRARFRRTQKDNKKENG